MTGLKLILSGTTFTDTTLPLLRDDPILALGSLSLLEPAHPANPIAAGLPASGTTLPNIASSFASKTVSGTLGGLFMKGSGWAEPASGKIERTPKGGIYVIQSRTAAVNANQGVQMQFSDAVKMYVANNMSHKFYFSVWRQVTRAIDSTYGYPFVAGVYNAQLASGPAANQVMSLQTGWTPGPADARTLGQTTASGSATGAQMYSIAAANGIGTLSAASVADIFAGYMWGAYKAIGFNPAGAPSAAVYRLYLEDLTVSGRTYAQVNAIDVAEHQKQVLTAGGRYYGDTFTDPTTVA